MKCDVEIAINKTNKTDKYNAFLREEGGTQSVTEGDLRNEKLG